MVKHDLTYAIFIDYDNLEKPQKMAGLLDVITKVLMQVPIDITVSRVKCDVRVYGGWYDGTQITRLAQDVTVQIQQEFPKVLRFPISGERYLFVSVNVELAAALLQEPSHHLFNTFRRKGKPSNVRILEPNVVGCTDPDCILPLVKKVLKTGSCPKFGCAVTVDNLVYRNEQKIVDTMLSCDLIHASKVGYDIVILVSGDDDFIPPLRTVLLQGTMAVRFHPKANCQRVAFPQGSQLIEKDL